MDPSSDESVTSKYLYTKPSASKRKLKVIYIVSSVDEEDDSPPAFKPATPAIVEPSAAVCVCQKSPLLKNIVAAELMGKTESKQDDQGNAMLQPISLSTNNTLNDLKTGKPNPAVILECNSESTELCSSQASFSPLKLRR